MINGRQISAARALLRMTRSELAELSNISVPTLKRMEASEGDVAGRPNNVAAVQTALEKRGISFVGFGTVSITTPKPDVVQEVPPLGSHWIRQR